MKVIINRDELVAPGELHINCHRIDNHVIKVQRFAENFAQTILGQSEGQTINVHPQSIYYAESIDKKTFLYLKDDVVECALRLYELEEIYGDHYLFRASKQTLVNLEHIAKVAPQLNRNLLLTMANGERVEMSRRQVPEFRQKIGMR